MTDGAQDKNGSCGRVSPEYSYVAVCNLLDQYEMTLSHRFDQLRTLAPGVLHRPAGEICLDIRANRGAALFGVNCRTLRRFCSSAPLSHVFPCRLADRGARTNQNIQLRDAQQQWFQTTLRKRPAKDHTLPNRHFHETMGDITGNRSLMPANKGRFVDHARIGMTLSRRRDPDLVGAPAKACGQKHDDLVECVEGGDEKGAAAHVIALCQAIPGTQKNKVVPRDLQDSLDVGASSSPAEAINPGERRAL